MNLEQRLRHKLATRTKPVGSLGRLEDIALRIGLIQQSTVPELHNPAIILFAADHGIACEGVSSCPREITHQMVLNFVAGGGGINVLARQHGIRLSVVDAGVDFDFEGLSGVVDAKVARGSNNMLYEPAMTIEQCERAMEWGRQMVEAEFERGCNVIGFGEMGIGNSSPAALLLHKYSGIALEDCVGRGAGLSDSGLERKYSVLKSVARRYDVREPLQILATFGGLEIAMICGGVLQARRRNMVIIADGFIATSGFVAAHSMEPDILDNTLFSHLSHEKGHRAMLDYLGVEAILQLDLRLGEGTGVALAYPIIRSATLLLNQMASFESAAVAETAI